VRKLFRFLRLDVSGSCTVEVFIDELLRHTTSVSGTRTRRLLRLPEKLLGYTWRIRLTATTTAAVRIFACEMQSVALEAA